MPAFVRTILGDIDPARLGCCYAHEHLIIDPSYTTEKTPDFQIDDVDACVRELTLFKDAGGRAAIDSMPGGGAGRNVLKLAEASRRAGVHIVAPTGLHLKKYYPTGHWSTRTTADELARQFIGEIEVGIDANDLAGPQLVRTPHRAGLIKIASGLNALDAHERKLFDAAAMAHVKTGCPILTHAEQGTAALEQVERLRAGGVDLAHVVLSHTDRRPDLTYHREILSTGVRVEYDSAFRWKTQDNPTLMLVSTLIHEFPDQIMLGMDAARRSYWTSYGGAPGLAFLLTTFKDQLLHAGVSQAQFNRIFVSTPAQAYAFAIRRQ